MARVPLLRKKTLFGFLLDFVAGFFDVLPCAVRSVFATHERQRVNGQQSCQYDFFHNVSFPIRVRAPGLSLFPLAARARNSVLPFCLSWKAELSTLLAAAARLLTHGIALLVL